MSKAEARREAPQEQPESEHKPKLIDEAVSEAPEMEPASGFMADADEFNRLQERAVNKALELDKLEDIPVGAKEQAQASLQKEMESIQGSIDKVVGKYGADAEDFVADAITKRDLETRIAAKRAELEKLSKIEGINYRGGSRLKDMEKSALMEQLADLHAEQAELLSRQAMEVSDSMLAEGAKLDLAEMTDKDIENAVDAIRANPFEDLKDSEIDAVVEDLDGPVIEVTDEMLADQAKEDTVNAVSSFDDLKIVLDHMKTVKGSGGKEYSAAELSKLIDQARVAPVLLGEITRANGLRDKVRELIRAERENEDAKKEHDAEETEKGFFKKGEAMSEAHARGEEYEEVLEVSDDMILSDEQVSAEEVKDLVEKNELSPERKAGLEKEVKALRDEIGRLEAGRFVYEGPENMQVLKDIEPGIWQLEASLKEQTGLSADDLMEKKVMSSMARFKLGVKSLFNPTFKKTMQMYEERTREWADAKDRLASAELELRDPQGYADLMQKRLMKTMLLRAKQAQSPRSSSGSPFNMRF
ncbi:MAG TPA: hypothetical protein VL426_03820 [Candidatus Binatia bacterium]|jgi:hypothetical protein|nr:hypothetical protein [Candidatus Binatia bacterium]